MYDWPEVAASVDRLWDGVRLRLRSAGIEVPSHLTHDGEVAACWFYDDSILDQVCSLTPVREARGIVVSLGTLHYVPPPGLPPCGPGEYYSVVVCRGGDRRRDQGLRAFGGARVAVNGTYSHSGYSSLGHHIRHLTGGGPLFGPCLFTGSHRSSIRAVATGDADLAAIDIHSWRLALKYEPAAAKLAVIDSTTPTPGAACVTSARFSDQVGAISAALTDAAAEVASTADGRALALAGFVPRSAADFEIVARRAAAAARSPWHQ